MEALQLCQVWPEETTGEALLSAERLTIILVMLGGISGAVCLLVDIADGRLSIDLGLWIPRMFIFLSLFGDVKVESSHGRSSESPKKSQCKRRCETFARFCARPMFAIVMIWIINFVFFVCRPTRTLRKSYPRCGDCGLRATREAEYINTCTNCF